MQKSDVSANIFEKYHKIPVSIKTHTNLHVDLIILVCTHKKLMKSQYFTSYEQFWGISKKVNILLTSK